MSFTNLTQPPRFGPKITNCLGFIRKDLVASYIDAIEVEDEVGDSCCPVENTYCLKVPCDLSGSGCSCITTPLINTKTGAPFTIEKGCLLDCIIISKCPGVCLDNDLKFILGALTADADASSCNRWIAESNEVCGTILNCACFIKLDAAVKCRDVQMEICGNTGCGTGCGGNQTLCDTDYSDVVDTSNLDCSQGNCGPCGRCLNCCDGSTPINATGDPCFVKPPGPCPILRFGELENSFLGITVCGGHLGVNDLTFTVKCWEHAGSKCGSCDECSGPSYLY